ncbi:MAG: hypothetical protein J7K64_04470 [Bacteroidales bacterium]|nr:hypothetical protein [Bacteroidales bacterium]
MINSSTKTNPSRDKIKVTVSGKTNNIPRPKIRSLKDRGYTLVSSVVQNIPNNYIKSSSLVIRESKYSFGWNDNTKILSKKDFLEKLKKKA